MPVQGGGRDDSLREPPRAVVVIVTRDRPQDLARNLGAALQDLERDGGKVLVVDQSSDQSTRRVVERWPSVTYMRSAPGLSRGRNAAVAASSAPFVAFTDDDVVLSSGWLGAIIRSLDSAPEIGAICGRAVTPKGALIAGARAGIYRRPTNPFGLGSGFNLAIRRSALENAGAFDEQLGAGTRFRSAEDTDMLFRIMSKGWAVLCSDDIEVTHAEQRSVVQQLKVHHGYGIGAGAQSLKHVRAGDRTARRIAARELLKHMGWFVRSTLTLRWLISAYQACFVAGFVRGAITARSAFNVRSMPPARTDPPVAR